MVRSAAFPLLALIFAGAVSAQAASPGLLRKLGVRAATVQQLDLPRGLPQSFAVHVRIGGSPKTLELDSFDIRSADFRLLVHGGNGVRELPPAPSVTYRGRVRGVARSRVAASLVDGMLSATVSLDGKTWVVQPTAELDSKLGRALHVVFAASASLPASGSCGVVSRRVVAVPHMGGTQPGPQNVLLAELAIDADFDYYKRNGSNSTNTQNRITTIVNAVDAIYKRDVEISFKISTILIRTTATYTNADPVQLVPELQVRWNQSHGNVRRDVVHLFSGKGSLTGVLGFAYLGSVCNLRWAYGASRAYDANLGRNVGLVAHQLAHSWDALHCDSTQSCNLMCSTFGGCSNNLGSFGPASKASIAAFRKTRRCLDDARPPQLTAVSPNPVAAFLNPRITLTGTVLSGVTEVQLGSIRIANGLVTSDTSVSFSMPKPAALGATPITVSSPAGRSNAVTLMITETRPPRLVAPGTGFGNFPITFVFGGKAKATWAMLIAPNSQTFKFMGFDILSNGFPLAAGALDSVGFGSFMITPPVGVRGVVASQIVTFQGAAFDAASNLGSTFFF